MDLDGAVTGDESLDAVAVDGIAAASQLIIHALHVFTDGEDVVTEPFFLCCRLLQHKFFGSSTACFLVLFGKDILILLHDVSDIDDIFLDGRVELGRCLVAHLLDHTRQRGVFKLDFAVLETSLQCFAG